MGSARLHGSRRGIRPFAELTLRSLVAQSHSEAGTRRRLYRRIKINGRFEGNGEFWRKPGRRRTLKLAIGSAN